MPALYSQNDESKTKQEPQHVRATLVRLTHSIRFLRNKPNCIASMYVPVASGARGSGVKTSSDVIFFIFSYEYWHTTQLLCFFLRLSINLWKKNIGEKNKHHLNTIKCLTSLWSRHFWEIFDSSRERATVLSREDCCRIVSSSDSQAMNLSLIVRTWLQYERNVGTWMSPENFSGVWLEHFTI